MTSMTMDNVLQMIVPAPDSHFLLLGCGCGADQTVYLQVVTGNEPKWVARCMVCGKQTQAHPVRHDAQKEWNKTGAAS